MQEIKVSRKNRFVRCDIQVARRVAHGQILADGGGLGHANIAFNQQRNRAERVKVQVLGRVRTRRKGMHRQHIRRANFFE